MAESFSSPPCFLHELDPSYLGYADRDEVLGLLNELLEAERAGAKVAVRLSHGATSSFKRYNFSFIPRVHDICFVFRK